jgi:hypothetical protein
MMRISFHKDPVDVGELCTALEQHGAVYWHSMRPNFKQVSDQITALGLEVLSACARPDGDFLNFLVRIDLVHDLGDVQARVAKAITRWHAQGEPVPHVDGL